ncbi:MAG: tRNA (N(6)-L-threonylcarbamoyladenosine(37)-C(2))-methylthiotransferase MtaB [Bacteroidota bacterium]|nr:tRNA (N(6)-L-threonylcarbamoyladenosine(37)-C(2))-methylthiotransferase MtaB [Bacteroidota bacterium]
MQKKIAFKTLGCRLNQYETDAIASEFDENNYQIVDFNDDADVYVVNTCTVTNQGDKRSRTFINQITKNKKNAVVIVTGCMVNNYSEKLESKLNNVTYFVDNERKTSIFPIVDSHFKGEVIDIDNLKNDKFGFNPAKRTFHTRSFIKIQDGCNQFCTYCIVPTVRGRAISRPFPEVIKNIKKVLEFGYKEIVLTGVNISTYEYNALSFENLIEKILNIPGDFRLRISSIEPDNFSDSFYSLFKNPKLTPHLHLCLQSGSDNILKKMRRMNSLKSFVEITDKIRKVVPDFNFTTDIIVGFPGETEEDFQKTIEAIEKIGFGHIHTFKYSIREGTRAAKMQGQIDGRIKSERSEIIRKISDEQKENYRKSMIGKTQDVLIEKIDDKGFTHGYGEHYIPVVFEAGDSRENEFVKVKISDICMDGDLILKGIKL